MVWIHKKLAAHGQITSSTFTETGNIAIHNNYGIFLHYVWSYFWKSHWPETQLSNQDVTITKTKTKKKKNGHVSSNVATQSAMLLMSFWYFEDNVITICYQFWEQIRRSRFPNSQFCAIFTVLSWLINTAKADLSLKCGWHNFLCFVAQIVIRKGTWTSHFYKKKQYFES